MEIDRVTVLRVTVTGDPTRRYELDGDITVRRNAAGKPALTPSKAAERWTSRRGGPA